MSETVEEIATAITLEDVMDRRTNTFNNFQVQDLVTQWTHKISVVPESVGITTRFWEYTEGVVRDGPEAKVPGGDHILNKRTGEYIVGDPALAGAGIRVEGEALVVEDDWWGGYTNRLNVTQPAISDGVGVGYKYFEEGEGDGGGALQDGHQEYVWFDSGVSENPDIIVPRDQWNGEDLSEYNISKGELFHAGGFNRLDHTFYNQGAADVNWGIKTEDGGLEIVTLHSFNKIGEPMWQQSDLQYQMATEGENLTGYINAAHYKAGDDNTVSRFNSAARDGVVFGEDVGTISAGDIVPLISIKIRKDWESVNVNLIDFTIQFDDGFYPVVLFDTELENENFIPPNSELNEFTPSESEYAVLVDNSATGFTDFGHIEYLNYSDGQESQGSNPGSDAVSEGVFPSLALEPGDVLTLGAIIIDATEFSAATANWGANF